MPGLGTAFALRRTSAHGSAEVLPRVDALGAAVEAARGRLDDPLLASVEATVRRARERLQVSTRHTVVALAGATGSGKSSLFNALAGGRLSAAGPERPTSAETSAVVCSRAYGPQADDQEDRRDAEDAEALLDWLGVPAQRRHRRAPGTGRLPDGLVLLDLPDHDSLQTAHHAEAERVLALADLFVWVVDPQKYADAALHQRLIQPHAQHRDVTMVVLNHVDSVPEDRRAGMLRDVRQVVVADGIRDPLVLATSARDGTGLPDLLAAVQRRVEDKRHIALRVRADLRTQAAALRTAAGEGPTSVPALWSTQLQQRLAAAAGAPGRAERDARELRAQVLRDARWAPRVGAPPEALAVRAQEEASRVRVDRRAVEAAALDLADKVTTDLSDAWGEPVRAAAVAELGPACDRLEAQLAALPPTAPAGWVAWLRPARVALAALAGGAAVLLAVLLSAGALGAGALVALLLLTFALGTAAGLQLAAPALAARAARDQVDRSTAETGPVIARAATEHVLRPVNAELAGYARFRRALESVGG